MPNNTNTSKLIGSTEWSNQDNALFYEEVPHETMENYLVQSGLKSNADLKLIAPRLMGAQSILEIGAGLGRVLEWLIQHKYSGEISAIERSTSFYCQLKAKFHNKVELHHMDILNFHTVKKFDVILWLWYGILDFPPTEQLMVLNKLSSFLSINGEIILNVPSSQQYNAKQNRFIHIDNQTLYRYLPSEQNIESYAKNLGLISQQIPSQKGVGMSKINSNEKNCLYTLSKKH